MRALGALVLAVAVVVAVAGCGGGDDDDGADDGPRLPDLPSSSARLLSETEACAEVRAGIDAFNEGDLEETVRHFETAVPLAEELVAEGEDAEVLLRAIEYYAALPPGEYLEASPSPEFQRHKAVTLTLCEYAGGPGEDPSDDSVPA